MANILITGISGFVGSALNEALHKQGIHTIRGTVRSSHHLYDENPNIYQVNLGANTKWDKPLDGVDVVFHTAARVHVMKEELTDPLAEFRQINVISTLNLARQAAAAGVRRFIFISSIKVNGEMTSLGQSYSAADTPAPIDAYGLSKKEAEDGLLELAAATGMDVVIVRPPLIYGPKVKANFASMMRYLDKGIPLPFGLVTKNQRSLVGLDNLTDFLILCIHHPSAANQIFLISDGYDLSTAELLRKMARAMNKSTILLPIPPLLLFLAAKILGKGVMAQRLLSNLQVDITKNYELLNWKPPFTQTEMLGRTAREFMLK